MPRIPRLERAPVLALGLSLLLLVDGAAVGPGRTVAGAQGDPSQNEGGRITSATSDAGDAVACAQGFVEVDNKSNMSLHGVSETGRGAIAVGYGRRSTPGHNGVRAPAAIVNRGDGWERVPAKSPGDEDGLMAVDWVAGSDIWAVGFTTTGPNVKPLAMRFNGSSWKVDSPRIESTVGVLTDVALLGDGNPFAVGYRMGDNGRRKALVLRKSKTRWRSLPMKIGRNESLTLTGASTDKKGGVWAVGHGGKAAEVKARIWNRQNGKWRESKLPKLKGESALTDVLATFGNVSWAVGYHKPDGATKPLVLNWNGKRWRKFKAPAWDSNDIILNGVSSDPAGGIWVVGSAWNDDRKTHESIAAWWDGRAWNEVAGRAGGTELHEASGSLSGDGWAVGRSVSNGRAVRVCTPPQAGIFGSAESSGQTASEPVVALLPDESDETDDADEEAFEDDLEEEFRPEAAAKNRKKGKRAKRATNKIGTLPVAQMLPRLVAKDVARPAGVYDDTGTYDAVVDDFDGDGIDDLFIGRHGRRGLLLLNRNGVFTEHKPLKMDSIDRHGCTSADVDGSGLPDLYCAVGGKRGSGLKSNELWLDPGGPTPLEVASSWGAADATGRGRLAAFLETKQPVVQLAVTNTPTRVDGLPSLTRLYRTKENGGFQAKASPGIAARLGARALQDVDFDDDGREDLLLVTGGPQTAGRGSTRLYRNTRQGLKDVTRKMRIKSFDEMDAELVDLNGDRKLDLVQLSENRLRVSLWHSGTYRKVYERRLSAGLSLAGGDVNGDGRDDLYIMRSQTTRNQPDVMLINRKDGKRWAAMVIPQVSGGAGDDAFAIDHDGNGLEDFLVLNGHNARGPTQLIAFYRR